MRKGLRRPFFRRRYADQKLKEEEQRAAKYLESQPSGSVPALTECCVGVLVTAFRESILAECPGMIRAGETARLQLMFSLMDRVSDGVLPMLRDLEQHIQSQGLADMLASADVITQVPAPCFRLVGVGHALTWLCARYRIDKRAQLAWPP